MISAVKVTEEFPELVKGTMYAEERLPGFPLYLEALATSKAGMALLVLMLFYRERAEKQRMYSVSQGLNSGWTTLPALSGSADVARRRTVRWDWICRSTCRLVFARRADS